jgi:hypothetical protein
MNPIDICLVSGCRPLLLEQTLESFCGKLIDRITIGRVIANIDLFGGGEEERHECESLILARFPLAEILKPTEPSFTLAVKSIWQRTSAPIVLHMEDDWLLLEEIDLHEVIPMLDEKTRAVKFLSKEHNQDIRRKGFFDVGYVRKKFFGITWHKEPYHRHGTAPGFFDGEFVRGWASRMDLSLDPEKQARPFTNPRLFDYVSQYQCRLLPGKSQSELIFDIGRAWRDERGIVKRLVDGRSIWNKI